MELDDFNDDYSDAPFWKPQEKGDVLIGVCRGEAQSRYDTPAFAIELVDDKEITLSDGEVIELEAGDIVRVSYSTLSEFLRLHESDLVGLQFEGEKIGENSQNEYKSFNNKWKKVEA